MSGGLLNFDQAWPSARVLHWCGVAICLLLSNLSVAEEPGPLSFEKDIASIFEAKCTRCHGAKIHKAELDLSSPQALLKGGSSGEAFVAHKPEESLLWEYIESDQMPPEEVEDPAKRLTEAEKKRIHDWIAAGAVFTSLDGTSTAKTETITEDEAVPVMLLHCTVCHGARKQEAGLDLRTRAAMLAGGRSGPAMVPGKPEESLLLKRIHAGEMPPTRKMIYVSVKPVEQTEIELLTKWIAAGAPESTVPEDVATTEPDSLVSDEDRRFWAFQAPRAVRPPRDQGPAAGGQEFEQRNAIDAFILEKLQAAGLIFAPQANLRTLVRRAYFDLTGLPPSPEELQQVLEDKDPRAYEKLIDHLLASPRYGERWGRYWLDLAGYADSEGKTDQDLERPFAYRYRDYVIRAFNDDKPYDQFLIQQLAGDELADYQNAPEITPEIYDNLVATGFMRMGPDGTVAGATNFVSDRLTTIGDELQVLGSAVLGLTIHCAKCHSHKFDPIPHRDYYRLQAVFKPALDEHDWLQPHRFTDAGEPPVNLAECRYLPHVLAAEREPIEEHNRPLKEQIAALKAEKEQSAALVREKLLEARLSGLADKDRQVLTVALNTAEAERSATERMTIYAMSEQLNLDEAMLREDAEYAKQATAIDKEIAKLETKLKPTPLIQAVWDRGEPSPTYILRRGEANQPTRRVGPGVLSVLTDGKTPFEVTPPWPGAKTTGRRLAFAKWLVDPKHPLTARVMVNRIWLHHFGRGIVETPDNFGKTGSPPSHPELLDWLAIEFIQQGWSIKTMHRLMMTSATYRQSSQVSDLAAEKDPENKLLSRMPLKRLEAESVRDSLLFASGQLDLTPFGPADLVDVRGDGLVRVREGERGWRRSIYVQQRRTALPTLLESFDSPSMLPNCVLRANSTVAPQALQLLNDSQVHDLARHFAKRVIAEAGDDLHKQLDRAFQIAWGRSPEEREAEATLVALQKLRADWLASQSKLLVESAAELWIHERAPNKVYENDLVSVWSRKRERGRRHGVVEFDLSKLTDRKIKNLHLELAVVEQTASFGQQAALIPPGIGKLTWNKFLSDKEPQAAAFAGLGRFAGKTPEAAVGSYRASHAATAEDLALVKERLDADGRIALVLMADDDGDQRTDWDDGRGLGTSRKRPRLVVELEASEEGERSTFEEREAHVAALASVCHALLNSAEFVYVD